MSSTSLLSLAATTLPGTATHPLAFALHYEFVDARLEGEAWGGAALRAEPGACARLLRAPGEFASPRNALWFGRGGARRLRCVYRLQAEGSRLDLTLTAAAFGRDPRCATRSDPRTGQLTCSPLPPDSAGSRTPAALEPAVEFEDDDSAAVPHLWVYESPWPGYRVSDNGPARSRLGLAPTVLSRVQVPLACLCDNSSAPLRLGGAGALELELAAGRLAAREDHRHVQFRGSWTRGGSSRCAAQRRLPPPGASVRLSFPYE